MAGEQTYVRVSDIGTSTAKARTNHVLVKVKADLPAPSGGVITLADNTAYEINGTIALGTDRIATGVSNIIYGVDKSDDILTYTGTSNMISSTNKDIIVSKVTLVANGLGSKVFSLIGTGTGTERLEISECIIANSVNVGSVTGGFATIVFRNNLVTGCAQGFEVSGTNGDLFITDNPMEAFTGTAVAFTLADGASTYHTVIISRNMFEMGSGQTALSIATAVDVTDGGIIAVNSFEGAGTYLSGIDAGTEGWLIAPLGNVGIAGKTFLPPFQLIDTTYSTTTDVLGLTTDVYTLAEPINYQPAATKFKSSEILAWVNHGQNGQQVVACLADNNAAVGDKILGFGFTGKFTISNINWQSGNTVRIEFDGKNGETTAEPFDLTRINVGETATFEGCTNATNDGTYIITAVNDAGTKYVEVSNANRTDATDDETLSPGEAYGGSIVWKVVTTAGVYEQITIPTVLLPANSDIRAGLRRGTTTGGNPTINIGNTDTGVTATANDGWLTTINF